MTKNITQRDSLEAYKGWVYIDENQDKFDLIIMDELNIAIDLKLCSLSFVLNFLKNKPEDLEVVITGRNAHPDIIEVAHLVTNMQPIKHYWNIGVKSRSGIEF